MVPQGLFGLGTTELIIILVVVLILFGGARLAGLGRASGQAIKEFKDAVGEPSTTDGAQKSESSDTPSPTPAK